MIVQIWAGSFVEIPESLYQEIYGRTLVHLPQLGHIAIYLITDVTNRELV